MRFEKTPIQGVYRVLIEPREDERGFFARTWCADEFTKAGLPSSLSQCSLSFSRRRGTLRGMHWQADPFPEGKLVRCTRGAVYDVAADLRGGSPSRLRWIGERLDEGNRTALWIPPGCAHGFLTLSDDAEVLYQMTESHHPECARGFRWDDPAVGISWPEAVKVISDRDRTYPDLVL